jgi:hypothetical protein
MMAQRAAACERYARTIPRPEPSMPEVHASRRFDAAPSAVFAAISDHAAFLSGAGLACRLLREGDATRDGVGAVREVRTGSLVFIEDIVAFEPPRHFAYVIRSLATAGGRRLPIRHERGWMAISREDGGTRVDWHSRFEVAIPLLGPLLAPLLAPRVRRGFELLLARATQRLAASRAG